MRSQGVSFPGAPVIQITHVLALTGAGCSTASESPNRRAHGLGRTKQRNVEGHWRDTSKQGGGLCRDRSFFWGGLRRRDETAPVNLGFARLRTPPQAAVRVGTASMVLLALRRRSREPIRASGQRQSVNAPSMAKASTLRQWPKRQRSVNGGLRQAACHETSAPVAGSSRSLLA